MEASDIPLHPGFTRSDVLERREQFVEYARANGAPVSGSTGAGGDAPEFLLREDIKGRWHADGALADARPTVGRWPTNIVVDAETAAQPGEAGAYFPRVESMAELGEWLARLLGGVNSVTMHE